MTKQEAPSPPDAAPHSHYMRPLDGLRGLACLLVVAYHAGSILEQNFKESFYNFGGMGVTIFFALSGFLMSTLYIHKKFSFDDSIKYGIARMARIAPAYWIAVLFVWALYLILPDDYLYSMTPLSMLRSLFFMGNVGVFWSIPPEIQFYVFFLLLWFCFDKIRSGNIWWALAVTILCAGFIGTRDLWGGLMLPSKIHLFLGGFLVAFLVKSEKIRPYLCHYLTQIALVTAIIVYVMSFLEDRKIYEDLVISTLIALGVGSLSQSTLFNAPLETQTMRLMGAASFSIYLLHDAMFQAMKTLGLFHPTHETFNIAVMCLLSLSVPVTFHLTVEKNLNRLAREKGMTAFEWMKERRPLSRLMSAGR